MPDTYMNIVIDEKVKRELERLARDNERSLSGQIRFMLEGFLDKQN